MDGKTYSDEELETMFPSAKAELDGRDSDEGVIKIELNDTNRPDLWSTAGLARQLKTCTGGEMPFYDFFSNSDEEFETDGREIHVSPGLENIRPYIVGFAVSGEGIDEDTLKDIIQTQEKLCWNFGRKRKSIAMGVYRSDKMTYPVHYTAADPDMRKFVPLQMEEELSLREIITKHPKGVEFGPIVADFPQFPLLTDANDNVLSFPPVINSADLGAVQVGDGELFVELTGTVLKDLLLAASIVACDLADSGFFVLPVKVVYPYETEFGSEIVVPYYFQEPMQTELSYVQKLLGEPLSGEEAVEALSRMGIFSICDNNTLCITVPEYRNDFLHPVDIIEDVMIGRGMETFAPVMPNSFTLGRLTEAEEFSRKAKDLMIGMGFQEMMYNYLGSRKDYIEKMHVDGAEYIQIANPMTENYEYVRASILPSLIQSESVSGNAAYPHNIFEVGKVAFLDSADNSGTSTRNYLGFLSADSEMGFNQLRSTISTLLYFLGKEYSVAEVTDSRFIDGRCGSLLYKETVVGIYGEVHPAVLESWGIQMPSVMCEIDLDLLLG